jgi:hypothetical protein
VYYGKSAGGCQRRPAELAREKISFVVSFSRNGSEGVSRKRTENRAKDYMQQYDLQLLSFKQFFKELP